MGFEIHYGKDFSDKANFFEKDGFKYIRLLESDYGFSFFSKLAPGQDLDVVVKLEGKRVGSFRVWPGKEWLVKRRGDTDAGFLFVAEKSSIAASRGVVPGADNNGGLELEFRIRKLKPAPSGRFSSKCFQHQGAPLSKGFQFEGSGGLEVRKGKGKTVPMLESRIESAEVDEGEGIIMEDSAFQSAPVRRARYGEESASGPVEEVRLARPPGGPPGGVKKSKNILAKKILGESGSASNERKEKKKMFEDESFGEESSAPRARDRSGATIEGRKTNQTFHDTESISDSDLDLSLSFSETFRMVVAGELLPMPALPPRID